MAMGNPLSPIFADIFLGYYENEWLTNCSNDFTPLFYRHYVDDTFAVFREIIHITDFFNYINKKHKSLKFTFEVENNHAKSSFYWHYSDYIEIIILSLPVFTINLHQLILQPISPALLLYTVYKLFAIRSLAHRIIHLLSNYEFITREFNKLSQLFLRNGYPSTLVNKTLKKLFDNWCLRDDSRSVINPNRPIINVNPIIYFYQSQYHGNVSLYMSKQLKQLCNRYFKDLKIIFACRSIRMHDFFCFKDIEYLNVYVHGWFISLLVVDVILFMSV